MKNSESEDIKSTKVFCKGCIYCSAYSDEFLNAECKNEKLGKENINYYEHSIVYGKCSYLNRNNDCKFKKSKPMGFFVFWRG